AASGVRVAASPRPAPVAGSGVRVAASGVRVAASPRPAPVAGSGVRVAASPRPAPVARTRRRWSLARGLVLLAVGGILLGGGTALVLTAVPAVSRPPRAAARASASGGSVTVEASAVPAPTEPTAEGAAAFVRYW